MASVADIRLMVEFRNHPKRVKLKRRLGSDGVLALVDLWLWAGGNRTDGNLAGMDDDDIEIAADWCGTPGLFVATLRDLHFLDASQLHGWQERQGWASGAAQRSEAARVGGLASAAAKEAARLAKLEKATTVATDFNDRSTTVQRPLTETATTVDEKANDRPTPLLSSPLPSVSSPSPIPPEEERASAARAGDPPTPAPAAPAPVAPAPPAAPPAPKPPAAWNADLETRWRLQAGVPGLQFPDAYRLGQHIAAVALQTGREPGELFDQAVQAFKAYRAECSPGRMPQLTPMKLIEHWATVWERLSGTGPPGKVDTPKQGGIIGPMGPTVKHVAGRTPRKAWAPA